ncbi:hypothetical protein NL676_033992 [Syzygium grande]|nr:hypothetical protein NL676_033992 [Syzygium grande]
MSARRLSFRGFEKGPWAGPNWMPGAAHRENFMHKRAVLYNRITSSTPAKECPSRPIWLRPTWLGRGPRGPLSGLRAHSAAGYMKPPAQRHGGLGL